MLLFDRLSKDHFNSSVGITSAIAVMYISYRVFSGARDRRRFKNIPVPSSDYPIAGMYTQMIYITFLMTKK
jgi:hypothetical protein